ncbi:methyltransferase domain-containing protein [Alphaproteobacteria bacterium HT1-32]|nr:methyltransferase domain-containing protein [Alphaproteobacteria bacterium HT1-32]
MAAGKPGGGARLASRGGRGKSTRVKTARGRKPSSTRWLQRQLNDPFVAEAKRQGYRSRAAFKLTGLDETFKLLRKGLRVVDLGCAPGGWTQVAAEKVGPEGAVVGIDLKEVEPLAGVTLMVGDMEAADTPDRLKQALGGEADLVMSDMAASSSGHQMTDHLRIMALAEAALDFAEEVLSPGGAYVAKVLQGGSEKDLLDRLKRQFKTVKHSKPGASRQDSTEMYVVALGFYGKKA